MPLQTSGSISLNEIHIEAGGSSGSQASINDSDIRGLINKSSGATMSFNEWYGASNVLWTPTMYVGTKASKNNTQYGYNSGVMGGMGDYTVDFLSNATLNSLRWNNSSGVTIFKVNGTFSNAGWTSWTTSATSQNFGRSSAHSFQNNQGMTTWIWYTSTNPFGTSGAITITFT